MAGNQMPLVLLLQDRLLTLADIHHIRTARIESAGGRRIQKIRRLSGNGAQADSFTFDAGECFDEPWVYGWSGFLKIETASPYSTILPAYIVATFSHVSA